MTDNTYGGTFRLFDKVLLRYGLAFSYVDTSDLGAIERAITPRTRLLFVETPTNPGDDASPTSRALPRWRTRMTSGSPSTTRSPAPACSGRSRSAPTSWCTAPRSTSTATATASAASSIAEREDDIEWLKFVQNSAGAILSPFDSWLVLRGTKTHGRPHAGRTTPTGSASPSILARHPEGAEGLLPRAAGPSAARARRAADAGVRRDARLRHGVARAALARC